ncbi:E3 ubiquitin-protein ligase Iruka [Phlebotomus papatasi]|uniref:E3 ubiquitin-protein ligase Iruka n=1 Tax=Phlebotomus papatasi TaxID=29031 RepID=UPI00248366D7|nr:E3 ubiquitin-protein ligase Iruka [Phlebotomus papatasi]
MAEVVQRPQRFYCHLCSLEIENVSQDFTCPLCSGGFIEELPSVVAADPSSSDDVEMPESTGDANVFPDLNHELLSSLFMSMTGARPLPPESGPGEGQSTAARTRGRTNRNRIGVAHNVNLDSFLHDFVISVMGAGPGTPMFFMGNPGDYAWGHEGIDTIVTQLLNQMEGTGPPPLAREKIDEIPKGEICQEQVETKLQCSVCLEDFQLNETVRQLPCSHLYHENCIVPWLELHGTCPICRKALSPEAEDFTRSSLNAAATLAVNSIRNTLYRTDNEAPGSSSSQQSQPQTSTNPPDTNQADHQTRNQRRYDDEFDFD